MDSPWVHVLALAHQYLRFIALQYETEPIFYRDGMDIIIYPVTIYTAIPCYAVSIEPVLVNMATREFLYLNLYKVHLYITNGFLHLILVLGFPW